MSDAPSVEAVREALRRAEEAASSYVDKYPAVEPVEWPTEQEALEAQARTILARLRSQVDTIRYEAKTDTDDEDIETIKQAMNYLQALLNDRPVETYE